MKGMRFANARPAITISGFAADANPNVTAPADTKIFTVGRTETDRSPATGLMLVALFAAAAPGGTFEADNAAATVSFVLWVQDAAAPTSWFRLTADTAIHRLLKTTADIRGGANVFVQVTAISGSVSADTVTIKTRET